jgi:hypothetical protein
MMVMVLRRAGGMGIVEAFPNLAAYVVRGPGAIRLAARIRGAMGSQRRQQTQIAGSIRPYQPPRR